MKALVSAVAAAVATACSLASARAESGHVSVSLTNLTFAVGDLTPDDNIKAYLKATEGGYAFSTSVVDGTLTYEMNDGPGLVNRFTSAETIVGGQHASSYTMPLKNHAEATASEMPQAQVQAWTWDRRYFELGAFSSLTVSGLAKHQSFSDLVGATLTAISEIDIRPDGVDLDAASFSGAGSSFLTTTFTNDSANAVGLHVWIYTSARIWAPSDPLPAIPEPGTYMLMLAGLLTVAGVAHRRQRGV